MNKEMSNLLQKKILLQALNATAETAQELGDDMVVMVLRSLMELKQDEFVKVKQLLWEQTAVQKTAETTGCKNDFNQQAQKIAC